MRLRSMLCVGAVAVIAPLACQVPAHAGPSAAAESVWGVPTAAPDDLSLIVAYSFGNRIPPGADPARIEGEPGPVNEALADAVVAARGDRDIPVFAQTTIAEVLESKYGMRDVVTIAADRNPDGTLAYLSTDGVAARVAELRGAAVSSDTVGVVAFRDHLWRATRTTAAHGFHAYAPRGIAMPDRYDPQSGQPWTTGPERYLPTDYAGRIPLLLNGLGR